MDGFLLIDKPAGITSFGVIARLRRITGVRRMGHAGTLDPFATGLLIVGVGRGATKRLGEFLGKSKTYEAVAVLGATTTTQDKDGEITPLVTDDAALPTEAQIIEALPRFRGELLQTPPMFSAKKIAGKRLYELAREGVQVERKPNTVVIHELELLNYAPPRATLRARVSKGTYVRTLAHDLGHALGCGAYLEELRRTASGDLRIEDAAKLEDVTPENWEELLKQLPPAEPPAAQ